MTTFRPMKRYVIGYYNDIEYRVVVCNAKGKITKELYKAGNNPNASEADQSLSASEGVGLDAMEEYCKRTTKELAREKKVKYAGVEYEPTNECG